MPADDDINRSITSLSKDFHLSVQAQRLLQIYFEIILYEFPQVNGIETISVASLERFMRRIGEEYLRPARLKLVRRRLPPGPRLDDQDETVSASDLLHVWDLMRRPYPYRYRLRSRPRYFAPFLDLESPEDLLILGFLSKA